MARIVQNTNQITSPVWAGDFFDRDHMIPGGARLDPAQFTDTDAVAVVVGVAGAAGGATSVPVAALSGPIPSGTVLNFGTTKFATLTAAAAAAAVTLTVAAIPTALVSGDTATYAGMGTNVTIPAGTVVGRTIAERDAGTAFGPAGAADDEVYIVCFDVLNAAVNPDIELYRPNAVVKENFLPGWTAVAAGVKTKVRAAYVCVRGAA
jgi:hypothetical protein